jgi:SAM-dependent methyltransferase
VSGTYSDVDGSSDPTGAVHWQDYLDGWPEVRAYKGRALELLHGARPVLDVGCGPGGDVVSVGTDRCVGLDSSLTMCAAAGARSATVCCADAHALPFGRATLGAVRTDRVLQHVERPEVVLDEIARVVRPGGRMVLAEPDQESLVIHLPGVRPDLVDRVKALRRDVGYRNGRLASSLPDAFVARDACDVSVDAFPLTITDPDDAFGLPGWPALWRDEGAFTDRDIAEWGAGVDRARQGGFVYAVTVLVVAGTAP